MVEAAAVDGVDATNVVSGCCGDHLVDWWPEGFAADRAVKNM